MSRVEKNDFSDEKNTRAIIREFTQIIAITFVIPGLLSVLLSGLGMINHLTIIAKQLHIALNQ